MTRHELKPPVRRSLADTPDTGHNRWHPDLPPALEVEPGDEIVVDCRDGIDGQITPATVDADLAGLDFNRGHPLSGPIAVRGAEPGDVLKVEILAVETDTFGSTGIFPGFGLLGDLFEEHYLVTWGLHDGVATSGRLEGVRIPADPFIGVIGVAPSHERLERFRAREAAIAEAGGVSLPPEPGAAVPAVEPYASTALRTIPPRETGGNLDVPQARAGATRLPARRRPRRAALARGHPLRPGRRRGLRHRDRGSRAGHDARRRAARRPGSASGRRRRRSSRPSRPGRAGAGTS